MLNFSIKTYFKIIFFISLISILSALFIEHFLGHQPCNLCLMQRIPYGLSIILIFLNYFLKKDQKFIVMLLALIFSFSFVISFYHFGIEQGFFDESFVCKLGQNKAFDNPEDLLKSLKKTSISCQEVTFRIFGLSLATINIFVSALISAILIKLYFKNEKN